MENCGPGFYGNSVNRECSGCPSVCLTCLDTNNCLSCTSGLFLQYGACVNSCTITDTLALYKNTVTMRCVTPLRCPSGTFALNSTITC